MNFLFARQSDCDQLPVVKLVVTQLPEPFFLAQALKQNILLPIRLQSVELSLFYLNAETSFPSSK